MLGFIIALIGGFAAPYLDDMAARPVADALPKKTMAVEDGEIRALSVLIALLVVTLVCTIFNSGSLFGIAVGMVIGYFLTRLVAALKQAADPK